MARPKDFPISRKGPPGPPGKIPDPVPFPAPKRFASGPICSNCKESNFSIKGIRSEDHSGVYYAGIVYCTSCGKYLGLVPRHI